MGLLRKLEITEGLVTIGFDLYAIYSPAFANKVVDMLHNYLPLPDGVGPFGVDYRTITRMVVIGGSFLVGLVALLDKDNDEKKGV